MKSYEGKNRIIAGLLGILLFTASNPQAGQNSATGSAQPRNPKAGRVRTLTPVLTIADEAESFFFKSPSLPQFGPDGSMYVLDQKQLLRFDAEGRLIRNYFKPGQGPGELEYVSGYSPAGPNLIVHNSRPSKLVRYDPSGQVVSDTPAAATAGPLLFRYTDGRLAYFFKRTFPNPAEMKGNEGIFSDPNPLLAVPVEGGTEKILGTFPTRLFFYKGKQGGVGVIPMDKVLVSPWRENEMAISHTEEYAVKILDTKSGTVKMTISRPYPRVKTPPEFRDGIPGGIMIDGQEVKYPASKYSTDIVNLLARGDELWVVTSTQEKGKGVLVDVFAPDGAFTDSFYLPFPAWPQKHFLLPDPVALQGDFLLALEKTEEGTYVLRKYRIGA